MSAEPESTLSKSQDKIDFQLTLSPRQMSLDESQSSRAVGEPPNSPNARSQDVSVADTHDTQQIINRHPAPLSEGVTFTVGVSTDKNKKCRRTMEDAHAFMYDFAGIQGQGYFAVFDGHAGKHAAEWCGQHFHQCLLQEINSHPDSPIPDSLNATFHRVDTELSKLAAEDGTHSGCTAVTVLLRLEDGHGRQFYPATPETAANATSPAPAPGPTISPTESSKDEPRRRFGDGVHRERIKEFFSSSSNSSSSNAARPLSTSSSQLSTSKQRVPKAKRVLYTANVGDARAVLWYVADLQAAGFVIMRLVNSRGGKAIRLTYDHKGSDAQEAKRITDAGGFVMNNRVNGVLAVTRSLGDSSMKEFVVGSPYTTETVLREDDEFLIVACDGLWDVCEDQEAVDLVRQSKLDAQQASAGLVDLALSRFSSDNLSVLVVRL